MKALTELTRPSTEVAAALAVWMDAASTALTDASLPMARDSAAIEPTVDAPASALRFTLTRSETALSEVCRSREGCRRESQSLASTDVAAAEAVLTDTVRAE